MEYLRSSRRGFLKTATLGGTTLAAAGVASGARNNPIHPGIVDSIAFYGQYQAGIVSPLQKHVYFVVLDLHDADLATLRDMFQTWTAYAARLTRGENVRAYGKNHFVPPPDTGEADSLSPHRLTLTFGISPAFLDKTGLQGQRPTAFRDLPHFPRDQMKSQYTGGDICIQACADDPQVAFHAVRNLVRVARSHVNLRWSQSGFNSFDNPQHTPRNLFAFKDGTANLTGEAAEHLVFVSDDTWLNNGTYMAVRRIRMFLETWDRTSYAEQNNTFGRDRHSGAVFGQSEEFDPVDLSLRDGKGEALVPEDSHVHLAKHTGRNILRRSYSYASGIDEHGQFDAGLLFISFQKDIQAFIDIQNAFGNVDKLNEYITHVGSGLFACFPGVRDESDYLGKALLG